MVLSNLDRDLLKSCLDKQPNSWEDFVERFLGLVKLVVDSTAVERGFVITKPESDELVAEVFQIFLADDMAILRQFRGQSSLGTYLVVVSRRIATSELHQRRRRLGDVETPQAPRSGDGNLVASGQPNEQVPVGQREKKVAANESN